MEITNHNLYELLFCELPVVQLYINPLMGSSYTNIFKEIHLAEVRIKRSGNHIQINNSFSHLFSDQSFKTSCRCVDRAWSAFSLECLQFVLRSQWEQSSSCMVNLPKLRILCERQDLIVYLSPEEISIQRIGFSVHFIG